MSSKPPNFNQALDALIKVGDALPAIDQDAPDWVKKIEAKVERVLAAKLGLEDIQKGDFTALGKIHCLIDLATAKPFQLSAVNQNENVQEMVQGAVESANKLVHQTRPALQKMERAVLAQTPEQKQAFVQGYAAALPKARTDGKGMPNWASPATPICIAMLLNWPRIDRMASVTELHAFLCQVFPGQDIQRKRVEGICRDIGLKLRGRGRPKKIKS